MDKLTLSVPGFGTIQAPDTVPTLENTSLGTIVGVILSVLTVGAIIITIGVIVWGALTWITSGGDKQKLEKARKTIIYAIIGMMIAIFGFVILRFVSDILGTGIVTP